MRRPAPDIVRYAVVYPAVSLVVVYAASAAVGAPFDYAVLGLTILGLTALVLILGGADRDAGAARATSNLGVGVPRALGSRLPGEGSDEEGTSHGGWKQLAYVVGLLVLGWASVIALS